LSNHKEHLKNQYFDSFRQL